ncbi:Phosphatidylinositol transfer protein alpha isoform [Bagarius yarrelli]|uniref:Phosphatidylinositol transfer protein alpha isoform n=1 Tax=Bagarius yarrelli TaxID=175774 RepID=A0A556TJV9_BAGYA|nr:Phosphatidylinositol transfer protein alpha isoform [Bagarius yarrelli]
MAFNLCNILYTNNSNAFFLQNEYMKENFLIKIETWHKPDMGNQENVHGLDPDTWKKVDVVYIDIADRTQVEPKDYKPEEDPAKFKSAKTGRGPLGPDWKKELPKKTECPHMCAYKLVTVKFKWWGLQNKVENFIQKQEKRLFTNFHRQLFCWLDNWIELNMDDIRRMEEETRKELDETNFKSSTIYIAFVWVKENDIAEINEVVQLRMNKDDLLLLAGDYILGYFRRNINPYFSDTHKRFVACLGVEHTISQESQLPNAHMQVPLRTLQSRLTVFEERGQLCSFEGEAK